MNRKIAIATCMDLPEPDPDEALLLAALEHAGARARMLPWDGPAVADDDELVVLRSTWNYHAHLDRFLAWVDAAAESARVMNPPAVVRRNARKTYLGELEAAGVPIVPTAYALARPRARTRLADLVRERDWDGPLVVKPVVSAGSFLTQRFEANRLGAAQQFLDEVTAQRDAMIQPWMEEVDRSGERALVWIDGELTHAVRKSPRFLGEDESVSDAIAVSADERALAELALATAGATDILYARVDVIRDGDGALRLMELELIEPSLFLKQAPAALDRLVDAIMARARVALRDRTS